VFQHFPRIKRHQYIPRIAKVMESRAPSGLVIPLLTGSVLFLLVCQRKHKSQIDEFLLGLANHWQGQIRVYEEMVPNNPMQPTAASEACGSLGPLAQGGG
jgi:hypothetical protein